MSDIPRAKMPTGISSLDPVLDGGIPTGSVVLLLGEVGAGNTEFVYSALLTLIAPEKASRPGIVRPAEITYITITKVKDDIIKDITLSFHSEYIAGLKDMVRFIDLSQIFFDNSIVPPTWYDGEDLIARLQKRQKREQESILGNLVRCLESTKPGSLIIIDSLTDIAPASTADASWNSLIAFLRGLQRVAKRWNSTIYLLLSSGILEKKHETEISDCVDAVVQFRWEDVGGQRRQRVLYFEKFLGVMPYLEDRDLVKFAIKLSATSGFEVRNIRVVV